MRKWEGGSGKSECGRRKLEGLDERCALRAFHLKSASLEVKFRTEDWAKKVGSRSQINNR